MANNRSNECFTDNFSFSIHKNGLFKFENSLIPMTCANNKTQIGKTNGSTELVNNKRTCVL